jgi:hypothetical protein
MIGELSSALEDFLTVQPIVKKTERDLLTISKQVDSQQEFKVLVELHETMNQWIAVWMHLRLTCQSSEAIKG